MEKTTDMSQVTDKLYHYNVVSSIPCHALLEPKQDEQLGE
jgi:hypothetical protein